MDPLKEIPLSGGNVNNSVVRKGNTVRRAMSAASPVVHQLLLHLESKGFDGCPNFLGIDEQNREVLSFLPGETGIPTSNWQSDEPLIAAAGLLRRYHDAVADFASPDDAEWCFSYPDSARHEVICHNDFAPYNFVYQSGIPRAVIDFDLAGPGPRLRDIAYAVYWMTPLSFNSADQIAYAEADLAAGCRRLRLFCETYGIIADNMLFDMVSEVLAHMGNESVMCDMLGKEAKSRLKADGHLEHWQKERAAFLRNRVRLEMSLADAIN